MPLLVESFYPATCQTNEMIILYIICMNYTKITRITHTTHITHITHNLSAIQTNGALTQ
jgi:hypothetical protein